MTELPRFPYHPDPVATGAFERRVHTCSCCGRERQWAYAVVPYAEANLRDRLCPDCIFDGSAAERFDARFTVIAGSDVPAGVSDSVVEQIMTRTPGFSAWEPERWLFCCSDGAEFLGAVGWEELDGLADAVDDLRRRYEQDGIASDDVVALVGSLDVDGAATAYLFRCRHCRRHLAYADSDRD